MFDIDNPFWIIALGQNSKRERTIFAGPLQTTAYQLGCTQYLTYVIPSVDEGGMAVPQIKETAATGIVKTLGEADADLAMPDKQGSGSQTESAVGLGQSVRRWMTSRHGRTAGTRNWRRGLDPERNRASRMYRCTKRSWSRYGRPGYAPAGAGGMGDQYS